MAQRGAFLASGGCYSSGLLLVFLIEDGGSSYTYFNIAFVI